MRHDEPRRGQLSRQQEESAPLDFEAVHSEHRGPILAYLQRLARDLPLAQELTQETFLRVSRSLGGFRGEAKLTTWLYRIATRVYLDHRRKEAVRSFDPERLPPDLAAAPAPGSSAARGPRLPDRLFEDSEMGRCIREFVDGLPPEYRAVIVLHDLQGLSNPEIAQVLDCSVATVKIRVHRAREQLRGVLSQHCELDCEDGVVRCDRKQPGGLG
jgi:RNA polymerase sigma-70 factor (ECF subfamily)